MERGDTGIRMIHHHLFLPCTYASVLMHSLRINLSTVLTFTMCCQKEIGNSGRGFSSLNRAGNRTTELQGHTHQVKSTILYPNFKQLVNKICLLKLVPFKATSQMHHSIDLLPKGLGKRYPEIDNVPIVSHIFNLCLCTFQSLTPNKINGNPCFWCYHCMQLSNFVFNKISSYVAACANSFVFHSKNASFTNSLHIQVSYASQWAVLFTILIHSNIIF